jgi:hypothetical protein
MIDASAAFLAWIGAALIVLADGRRGLAAGLGLVTLGLFLLAVTGGDPLAGLAVGVGGAIATFRRWRHGPAGWGLMPPGSTGRLVLCVASGLLVLWIAAAVTTGAGAPIRFAVLVVVGLMGARALATRDAPIVLTAVAGLALALAEASGLSGTSPGLLPYVVGAVAAAGATVIPQSEQHGA